MALATGEVVWPAVGEVALALVVAGAWLALYLMGVARLRGGPRAVPHWRIACFVVGVALVVVALASPVAALADELFWAHMGEHLLLGDLAALLFALGITGPLLAPLLRLPGMSVLRILVHPVVAYVLWAVNLYAWHVAGLHEQAVRDDAVHALQHVLFIALGLNMWLALLGPLPKPSWFGNAAILGYVVAVRLTAAVLGNALLFGGGAFYGVYAPGEAAWGISPAADQVAAGAVMMVEGSLLTLGLLCWLFLRTARQTDERQDLVELAAAHGIELSERRAARAVGAGRGAELRERIAAGELPERTGAAR